MGCTGRPGTPGHAPPGINFLVPSWWQKLLELLRELVPRVGQHTVCCSLLFPGARKIRDRRHGRQRRWSALRVDRLARARTADLGRVWDIVPGSPPEPATPPARFPRGGMPYQEETRDDCLFIGRANKSAQMGRSAFGFHLHGRCCYPVHSRCTGAAGTNGPPTRRYADAAATCFASDGAAA